MYGWILGQFQTELSWRNSKENHFNINIIQVYAPTTDHDDEEVEKFYDDIENVMKYAKSGEINIMMGD